MSSSHSPTTATERDFMMRDSKHLLENGLMKHQPRLKPFVLTLDDIKEFAQMILDCEKMNRPVEAATLVVLDQKRQECKDQVGVFRTSAWLVAHGKSADDDEAARMLKVHVHFPETDGEMLSFRRGLAAGFRKYGAKLAEKGFSRAA